MYPKAGGAVVHGGQVAHEALPVTNGTRYVIAFFIDEDPSIGGLYSQYQGEVWGCVALGAVLALAVVMGRLDEPGQEGRKVHRRRKVEVRAADVAGKEESDRTGGAADGDGGDAVVQKGRGRKKGAGKKGRKLL